MSVQINVSEFRRMKLAAVNRRRIFWCLQELPQAKLTTKLGLLWTVSIATQS